MHKLSEVINTAHGYNEQSQHFKMFLKYITEIKPSDRPAFV